MPAAGCPHPCRHAATRVRVGAPVGYPPHPRRVLQQFVERTSLAAGDGKGCDSNSPNRRGDERYLGAAHRAQSFFYIRMRILSRFRVLGVCLRHGDGPFLAGRRVPRSALNPAFTGPQQPGRDRVIVQRQTLQGRIRHGRRTAAINTPRWGQTALTPPAAAAPSGTSGGHQ